MFQGKSRLLGQTASTRVRLQAVTIPDSVSAYTRLYVVRPSYSSSTRTSKLNRADSSLDQLPKRSLYTLKLRSLLLQGVEPNISVRGQLLRRGCRQRAFSRAVKARVPLQFSSERATQLVQVQLPFQASFQILMKELPFTEQTLPGMASVCPELSSKEKDWLPRVDRRMVVSKEGSPPNYLGQSLYWLRMGSTQPNSAASGATVFSLPPNWLLISSQRRQSTIPDSALNCCVRPNRIWFLESRSKSELELRAAVPPLALLNWEIQQTGRKGFQSLSTREGLREWLGGRSVIVDSSSWALTRNSSLQMWQPAMPSQLQRSQRCFQTQLTSRQKQPSREHSSQMCSWSLSLISWKASTLEFQQPLQRVQASWTMVLLRSMQRQSAAAGPREVDLVNRSAQVRLANLSAKVVETTKGLSQARTCCMPALKLRLESTHRQLYSREDCSRLGASSSARYLTHSKSTRAWASLRSLKRWRMRARQLELLVSVKRVPLPQRLRRLPMCRRRSSAVVPSRQSIMRRTSSTSKLTPRKSRWGYLSGRTASLKAESSGQPKQLQKCWQIVRSSLVPSIEGGERVSADSAICAAMRQSLSHRARIWQQWPSQVCCSTSPTHSASRPCRNAICSSYRQKYRLRWLYSELNGGRSAISIHVNIEYCTHMPQFRSSSIYPCSSPEIPASANKAAQLSRESRQDPASPFEISTCLRVRLISLVSSPRARRLTCGRDSEEQACQRTKGARLGKEKGVWGCSCLTMRRVISAWSLPSEVQSPTSKWIQLEQLRSWPTRTEGCSPLKKYCHQLSTCNNLYSVARLYCRGLALSYMVCLRGATETTWVTSCSPRRWSRQLEATAKKRAKTAENARQHSLLQAIIRKIEQGHGRGR